MGQLEFLGSENLNGSGRHCLLTIALADQGSAMSRHRPREQSGLTGLITCDPFIAFHVSCSTGLASTTI